jgi:hypothetical protein
VIASGILTHQHVSDRTPIHPWEGAMKKFSARFMSAIGLLAAGHILASAAWAGPPFLTDDPEPVDYRHFEAYVFSTLDRTKDDRTIQIPAFEFNWGVFPDVQFHTVVPLALDYPSGGPGQYGIGDIEVGIKYRFVEEKGTMPQVGIFPMLEIPSGDADRGLGNGRSWVKLPLWIQKSWEKWTTYGGGGYAVNHAPDQRNFGFGGWLLQRDIGKRLTLGGELFLQGAPAVDGHSTGIFNFGGYYKFTPDFELLFSGGHSITGEGHTVGYLGIYWTWGAAGVVIQ